MKKIIFLTLFLFTNLNAEEFKLERIASGFEKPWSLTFVNDNSLLVTEKPGNIKLINIKEKKS